MHPAPTSRLFRTLFPDPPRDLPGRRGLKIVLRAAHVVCVALFVGSHAFATAGEPRLIWLAATAVSGGMILVLDLHESCAFLLQVRGAVLLLKIALFAALPWFGDARLALLCGLLFVAVVSSHAPAKIRYFLLFGRDLVIPAKSRG